MHNAFEFPHGERKSTNELDNVATPFAVIREKCIPSDRKTGYQKVAVSPYSVHIQLPFDNKETSGVNFSEN